MVQYNPLMPEVLEDPLPIYKQLRVSPSVNTMDPPEHVQNRALISGAFEPRRVEALAPVVDQIAARHAKALETNDEMDLVADYIAKIAMNEFDRRRRARSVRRVTRTRR